MATLLLFVFFVCWMGVSPFAALHVTAHTFTAAEMEHAKLISQEYLVQRAAEPFVHTFNAGKFGPVLIEVLKTAEQGMAERNARLREAGLWIPAGMEEPPVCAAGLSNDVSAEEVEQDGRVDAREDDRIPCLEVHYRIRNCLSNGNVMYDSRGWEGRNGGPQMVSLRLGMFDMLDVLAPLLPLIPEGEEWRVEIPLAHGFNVAQGAVTNPLTPPGCLVTYDIETVKVHRGKTSLTRCRQRLSELVGGYDPHARDRERREGKPEREEKNVNPSDVPEEQRQEPLGQETEQRQEPVVSPPAAEGQVLGQHEEQHREAHRRQEEELQQLDQLQREEDAMREKTQEELREEESPPSSSIAPMDNADAEGDL